MARICTATSFDKPEKGTLRLVTMYAGLRCPDTHPRQVYTARPDKDGPAGHHGVGRGRMRARFSFGDQSDALYQRKLEAL